MLFLLHLNYVILDRWNFAAF